jgi:hypothetical protein
MGKEVNLNPIPEEDLEDKRNEISESCFVEVDIALKGYGILFGEDSTYEEISLLHTTLAYALSNHKNKHNLSNVNIDEFEIPESPFKNKDGEPTDKLYQLEIPDAIHYVTNMVMNSKAGIIELLQSGYFEDLNQDLMIEKQGLLFQLSSMYDRSILSMNNKYSKLILNIK